MMKSWWKAMVLGFVACAMAGMAWGAEGVGDAEPAEDAFSDNADILYSMEYEADHFYVPGFYEGFLPLSVGIVPPLQLAPEKWDVYGVRMNFGVGRNRQVDGIDLGLIGNETLVGAYGVQMAGVYNLVGHGAGIQAAFVNCSRENYYGIQCGIINRAEECYGVQVGLLNRTDHCGGLQVGLVNCTETMTGVQLGLFNIIADSYFTYLPLVNAQF